MSLSLNIQTANEYYAGDFYRQLRTINYNDECEEKVECEEKAIENLRSMIKNNDLNGLINSNEFKNFDINFRFTENQTTILHLAYFYNKPQIVEFLIKNGADERIPNDMGLIPIERAKDDYQDSLPRVVNEVVRRYFENKDNTSVGADLLFDVALQFILEKKWKYYDTEGNRKQMPFRDGRQISSLGLPELAYNVNCTDLTHLFVKSAHQIGLEAQEEWYRCYKSIQQCDKEKFGILGEIKMFDSSRDSSPIQFDHHCVAYSSGWYYDLTLMCKYRKKESILEKS